MLNWISTASLLKQQLVDILILSQPVGGISWFWVNQLVDILILSQPVFVLTLKCCVFSGKPTNTNFDVFCLSQTGLEAIIYHAWGEHPNYYTTDMVTEKKNGYNRLFTYLW